jgi:hypothetical protein
VSAEVLSAEQWAAHVTPDRVERRWLQAQARPDFCPTCCEAPCAHCDPDVVVVYRLDRQARTWQRIVVGR